MPCPSSRVTGVIARADYHFRDMAANGVVDITILGAGPAGLAAAYYAGHRDASVRIVDSIEQLGGQVAAVYPEKHVYDVAGPPKNPGPDPLEVCAGQGGPGGGGGAPGGGGE